MQNTALNIQVEDILKLKFLLNKDGFGQRTQLEFVCITIIFYLHIIEICKNEFMFSLAMFMIGLIQNWFPIFYLLQFLG